MWARIPAVLVSKKMTWRNTCPFRKMWIGWIRSMGICRPTETYEHWNWEKLKYEPLGILFFFFVRIETQICEKKNTARTNTMVPNSSEKR